MSERCMDNSGGNKTESIYGKTGFPPSNVGHKGKIHKMLYPQSSHQPQHHVYPYLPPSEYNNLNSPPSPTTLVSPTTGGSPQVTTAAIGSSSISLSTLEKYSSVLISELKKKPQKEKTLKDALDIQDKINSCEVLLRSAEVETSRRRQALQDQIDELDRKREELKKNITSIEVELEKTRENIQSSTEALKASPEYLDKNGVDRISREIDHLNFHTSKVRTVSTISTSLPSIAQESGSSGPRPEHEDISAICPVCLTIPDDQIYTCVNCDNPICGKCRVKLTSCPTCRKSFKNNNMPRRNRLAEKLIASRK